MIAWQHPLLKRGAGDFWVVDTSRNTCRWSVGAGRVFKSYALLAVAGMNQSPFPIGYDEGRVFLRCED